MRTLSPGYIANFDSASSFLRAIARYLKGKDFPAWGLSAAVKRIVPVVNLLPQQQREFVYAVGGMNEAISPAKTHMVDAEKIARWATDLYPPRRYPGILIGSSSGALVHLAAALGMPWLPQTVFIPVRQTDVHPDDAVEGLNAGREAGHRLLAANPDVQLHHMHDPNQDRLMLQYMTYFRIKWRKLPQAYEDFIQRSLLPGAPVIIVDCKRTWPATQVDDRYFYQFGALGGAREEEFFNGGPRVASYLSKYKSHRTRWQPPPPDLHAPEAEWGFESALGPEIDDFAHKHGFKVTRLCFEEPEDLSPLVADLYRTWYRERKLRANRLLVESFILVEPYWAFRTGSVPFWMKFNMEPSHEALGGYLDACDPYDEIWISLFQHGVECVGLVPIEKWLELLKRARRSGGLLGVDKELHPRDFGALARYQDAVQQEISARYPLSGPVPLERVQQLLADHPDRYGVQSDAQLASRPVEQRSHHIPQSALSW